MAGAPSPGTVATRPQSEAVHPPASRDVGEELRPIWAQIALWVFIVGPFLGLIAAVWHATRDGISWVNVVLTVVLYSVTALGVTIGFHRHFTHRAFRARRPLRIVLAIAGSMSLQGSIIMWVADHRRHHAYSDRDGDPHSPWRYGTSTWAVTKGFVWSHVGWLFEREETSRERFAPDLLADRDIVRIDRLFPLWAALGLLLPAGLGWVLSGFTWEGAWTALLWGGFVRVFLLHHVTFSINSICHIRGDRPFATRDRSGNVWPLALLSFGESWHNYHHADPTSARHGVERGQVDLSAVLIRAFERLRWVSNVRWPDPERIAGKRRPAAATAGAQGDG